jgi:WD40 repeat protein
MQGKGSKFLVHSGLTLAILASGLIFHLSKGETVAAAGEEMQRTVYLDRANNVWTSRTDGSETRQLTTEGGYGHVQVSADGSRILATGPYGGETGIFLMSPEPGFGSQAIASGRLPAWSPDSSHFAFADGGTIHIFNRNGEYVRSTAAPAHVLEWSPDGQRLGFARNIVDPYGSGCAVRQLGWIDADSGEVATAGTLIGNFTWSGDGTEILHLSAVDGNIRAQSVTEPRNTVITDTSVNPCGAPFFTTSDGERLIGLRWFGEGPADLVAIDLSSGEERIYTDVPVRFPSIRLPNAYVSGDTTGRYVFLSRSFPTYIHRLDLDTGQLVALLTNDWRRVLGVAPDGSYFALLNTPSGRAHETTIHHTSGESRMLENVGWMTWAPSPANQSAALAWLGTWEREDRPVMAGESRTWLWGPEHFDVRVESYDEAPDGVRAVRYYDKSRMEITHPAGDRNDDWYVTNGLLVRELITGQMQVGDSRFIDREPAQVPVAGDGDDPNSPTYATLQSVLDAPATEPGTEVTETIDRAGNVGQGGPGGVTAAHYVDVTDHTVADVFWDYLNSTGRIWDGQSFREGQLFQPTFFATGFPITEAYWSTVRVAGEERNVLMQCFERRCLTYTPDNPEGWQVEMGNVGRHYHAWRY